MDNAIPRTFEDTQKTWKEEFKTEITEVVRVQVNFKKKKNANFKIKKKKKKKKSFHKSIQSQSLQHLWLKFMKHTYLMEKRFEIYQINLKKEKKKKRSDDLVSFFKKGCNQNSTSRRCKII